MHDIPIFSADDDCPHAPSDDLDFQESSLFVWHDLATGVAGFWRLGQEATAGKLNSCFGLFTADGLRFRSNVAGVPMTAADRGDTHMGWGSQLRVDLDKLHIRAVFPDCTADLQFEDFLPRFDYFAVTNRPGRNGDQMGHHFEVAGRMTGRIVIGGRIVTVDALGYRDRSWGSRRWSELRCTRWWPAVFGPDLCVHVSGSVHESGKHGCYGYVVRDGKPEPMIAPDVVATLDYDGVGPRAGCATFTLGDGTAGEVVHERSDAIVMQLRGYTAVESIGVARWGDRVGMSLLEVSANAAGGSKPPVVVLAANQTDGLSRR